MKKAIFLEISFVILFLFPTDLKCNDDGKRLPPKIFNKWKDVDYYQKNTTLFFNCKAEGANLLYSFYKNDSPFMTNDNGIFALEDHGNVRDGVYQCKVTNHYGTSVTDKTQLKKAVNVEFLAGKDIQIDVNNINDPLNMRCTPIYQVVPDALVRWYRISDNYKEVVNMDEIQFDGKDTLYFTNAKNAVKESFHCIATNPFLSTSGNSSKYVIVAKSNKNITNAPIRLLTWSSSSSIPNDGSNIVNGLVDSIITLRCLFYSIPKPRIEWLKDDTGIDHSKWEVKSGGTEITSKHPLDSTYQGLYTCKGIISGSTFNLRHDIHLHIRVLPNFKHVNDHPMDTILVEDGNTTFKCFPTADPAADITWYRNGELLKLSKFPNYNLDNTDKELTISNLSIKDDSCVIRCEAWNIFGHISSEGYLAVIEPTKLDTDSYKDVIWYPKGNLTFHCKYTGEVGYPVNCSWFHVSNNMSIEDDDDRVIVDDNGTLIIVTENDQDGGRSRLGTYKVMADNTHSVDEKEFQVIEEAIPEPIKHVESLWWISLIVIAFLLLLLLLFLLLWCCCCRRRRQKEDYHVDKKERLMGKDPVKELQNMGFHDYQPQLGQDNISFTPASGTLPTHPLPTYYATEIDSEVGSMQRYQGDERSIASEPQVMMWGDPSNRWINSRYPSEPLGFNHGGMNEEVIMNAYPVRPNSMTNYPYHSNNVPFSEV